MKFVLKYYVRKRVIKFERLKIGQILRVDKTGFLRPGHIIIRTYLLLMGKIMILGYIFPCYNKSPVGFKFS